jgi:hypothetical protein
METPAEVKRLPVLYITIQDGARTATAEIPSEFAPALRSALRDLRDGIGGLSLHSYAELDAQAQASAAVAALYVVLSTVVPKGDSRYRNRDGSRTEE